MFKTVGTSFLEERDYSQWLRVIGFISFEEGNSRELVGTPLTLSSQEFIC